MYINNVTPAGTSQGALERQSNGTNTVNLVSGLRSTHSYVGQGTGFPSGYPSSSAPTVGPSNTRVVHMGQKPQSNITVVHMGGSTPSNANHSTTSVVHMGSQQSNTKIVHMDESQHPDPCLVPVYQSPLSYSHGGFGGALSEIPTPPLVVSRIDGAAKSGKSNFNQSNAPNIQQGRVRAFLSDGTVVYPNPK